MKTIIEKLTDKMTRITLVPENQWKNQEFRFRPAIESNHIKVFDVNSREEALEYGHLRTLFREYISSTNPNDIIIERFE